jgi:hypothetical protein
VEIKNMVFQGHLGQKIRETPISNKKLEVAVHTYNPRYPGGTGRSVMVQAGPEQKV